jgi:1-deoxy-D-xylulose-5-phosphate synthase
VDFSAVFGQELCSLAAQNDKICAVTAAMTGGTGLTAFSEAYPKRFFDVGIAEEHAVAMSAGLAARGMIPVCAIYSTFLQRAYDQMIHDVAIQGNHVVFAVDRAGLVGADGETHQGAFDVPYLRTIPGMKILAPSNFTELRTALRQAVLQENGPVAVRYPRGAEGSFKTDTFNQPAVLVREGAQVTLCTYGCMLTEALAAADKLAEEGISAAVVKINDLTDDHFAAVMDSVAVTGRLLVLEDCVEEGCLGQLLSAKLLQTEISAKLKLCNLGKTFVQQGTVQQLYSACNIDAQSVVQTVKELFHE